MLKRIAKKYSSHFSALVDNWYERIGWDKIVKIVFGFLFCLLEDYDIYCIRVICDFFSFWQ
jgi:hypothetical protein